MQKWICGLLVLSMLMFSHSAFAAETVALTLIADGEVIQGENTQTLGRENTIEVLDFTQETAATGKSKVQYKPIVFFKRVDKATPRLAEALKTGKVIDAEFKFFRPNPAGDGTTEQFFTIHIKNGRIISEEIILPSVIESETVNVPILEKVQLSYEDITYSYTNGNITDGQNTVTSAVYGGTRPDQAGERLYISPNKIIQRDSSLID